LNAVRNFKRRTRCPVCIKCYVTINGNYPWNRPFYKMCEKFGAKVQYLSIIEESAGGFAASRAKAEVTKP
jgi:hypothetical protein